MAGLTKIEGGIAYPAQSFLYRAEANKPSTWSLRIYEAVGGELSITKAQLDRAAAALNSKGFMGNNRVRHSGKTHDQLKKDLLSKYKEAGIAERFIPRYLLPVGHIQHSKPLQVKRQNPTEKFMAHYGAKGMKWGIRKDRRTGGQKLTAKAKGMSDDDLKTTIKRMQLERQYSDLVSKENQANQTRVSRGKRAVEKAVKDAGQEQLKNVISSSLGFGIKVGKHQISQTPKGKILLDYAGPKEKKSQS